MMRAELLDNLMLLFWYSGYDEIRAYTTALSIVRKIDFHRANGK